MCHIDIFKYQRPAMKMKKPGYQMGNVLWKLEDNKIQNFQLVALPIIKKDNFKMKENV